MSKEEQIELFKRAIILLSMSGPGICMAGGVNKDGTTWERGEYGKGWNECAMQYGQVVFEILERLGIDVDDLEKELGFDCHWCKSTGLLDDYYNLCLSCEQCPEAIELFNTRYREHKALMYGLNYSEDKQNKEAIWEEYKKITLEESMDVLEKRINSMEKANANTNDTREKS